jgi:hypothetical protein
MVKYSTPEMSTNNISTLEDKTTTLSRNIRHQPHSDEGPNRNKKNGYVRHTLICDYCSVLQGGANVSEKATGSILKQAGNITSQKEAILMLRKR